MHQGRSRGDESRRRILNTFAEMVAERGYDSTTFGDLASAVHMSRGTIMSHFGSKEGMLEQMIRGYVERRTAEMQMVRRAFPTRSEQLAGVIMTLITAFRDDYAATRAFSREFMRFAESDIMGDIWEMRADYTNEVRTIIEEGVREGEFACDAPLIATLQIIGMCAWCWTWVDPDGELAVEAISDMFASNILRGLSANTQPASLVDLPDEIARYRAGAD